MGKITYAHTHTHTHTHIHSIAMYEIDKSPLHIRICTIHEHALEIVYKQVGGLIALTQIIITLAYGGLTLIIINIHKWLD